MFIGNDVCRVFISEDYKELVDMIYKLLIVDKKYDKAMLVTDKNVYKYCYGEFIKELLCKSEISGEIFESYIIEPGEENKNIETYGNIISACSKHNMSRKSLIIALGGGVVGDIAGFAAATYMRGIEYIQVPTSLLSQVDSAIGGKTGIDIGNHKNTAGAFLQPLFTYINISALKTLSDKEVKSGIGEVIKYSMIADDDGDFIEYLLSHSEKIKNNSKEEILYTIKKCAEFKSMIVKNDEKESGMRKILNFGHTFGHAVEILSGMSHGEAVSIGMRIAMSVSLNRGYIDVNYSDKISEIMSVFDMPEKFDKVSVDDVFELLKKDKKNSFGKINTILPYGNSQVKEITFENKDTDSLKKSIIKYMN